MEWPGEEGGRMGRYGERVEDFKDTCMKREGKEKKRSKVGKK